MGTTILGPSTSSYLQVSTSVCKNCSLSSSIPELMVRNLHQQLPRDLDFFVLFSSPAGTISSQGQSNYAAGNTFQDKLAAYRLARG
ncbi:KR domain-containing protein [Ustulina deusta]|nr:KR domain-containing protein [Ustulina deusta]